MLHKICVWPSLRAFSIHRHRRRRESNKYVSRVNPELLMPCSGEFRSGFRRAFFETHTFWVPGALRAQASDTKRRVFEEQVQRTRNTKLPIRVRCRPHKIQSKNDTSKPQVAVERPLKTTCASRARSCWKRPCNGPRPSQRLQQLLASSRERGHLRRPHVELPSRCCLDDGHRGHMAYIHLGSV